VSNLIRAPGTLQVSIEAAIAAFNRMHALVICRKSANIFRERGF